ncbi:membrane bound O-acyl transferase family-domain-containing protein [Xylariomycetidae sp. FL0641]|nr:membrane bound O-acyl transferase family-domain-containing protein [Xylariomycetidae sp. FL0641]
MTYNPLLDTLTVALATIVVVGFTPASSSIRPTCLPILGLAVWHCVTTCPSYMARSSWASSVGGYTLSCFLHYLDVAVLSRWSFELQGPANEMVTPVHPGPVARGTRIGGILPRLAFGCSICASWRFINTPYQVRNVPQLSEKQQASRRSFLMHTAATIAACYLVLDLMDSSSDASVAEKFYSPDKVDLFSRLRDVTIEEIFMRLFAALGLCAGLVSVQRGFYSLASFVCVAVGLNEPADWPPFNGPLLEVYSLRTFWSVFWHQINTHRLYAISNYVLFRVLGVSKGSTTAHYIRPWLVFLISGALHVAIDLSAGIPIHRSGAMPFFALQPLGILIEDVFLNFWQQKPGSRPVNKPMSVQRALGVIWVGLWMAWTAPVYLYPILAQGGGSQHGVLPVSALGFAKDLKDKMT